MCISFEWIGATLILIGFSWTVLVMTSILHRIFRMDT